MPRLHLDALIYCLAWAALAFAGWHVGGLKLGLLLSAGLFVIVMPASAFVLTRTGNFGTERAVRWGILALATLAFLSFADLGAI